MRKFNEFRDILESFHNHNVEHVVFGAQAMIAHGVNRYTADLDVWVRPTPENIERMVQAFDEFGVPRSFLPLDVESFLSSEHHGFNVGRAPVCIDIHNQILGMSDACELELKSVHGVETFCLTVEELVRSKRASGRDKDFEDIDSLLQLHGK